MPKIKTIKSFAKRFKKTSSGKFKYKQSNLRHILTKKSRKYKRHLRKKKIISKNNFFSILKCLPYL